MGNISNVFVGTPLCIAARKGHIGIVQLLLNIGADPNQSEPLREAVRMGHKEIVVLLLSNGANPNPNMEHVYHVYGPLTIALQLEERDLAQILLDWGAVPNEEDKVKMEKLA